MAKRIRRTKRELFIDKKLERLAVIPSERSRLKFEKLSSEKARLPAAITTQRLINKEIRLSVAAMSRRQKRGKSIFD